MCWHTMPLEKLAFFLAEIGPLRAAESIRRVNELRVARASKDDRQLQMMLIGWENEANRKDRIIQEEMPKMTKAEYYAGLAATGVKIV